MKTPVNVLIGCVIVICGGCDRPSVETKTSTQTSTGADGGAADVVLIESDAELEASWPGQCLGSVALRALLLPVDLPAPVVDVTASNGCGAAAEVPTPSAGATILVSPPLRAGHL